MKALVINCTLKSSPERSNTAALADIVAEALQQENVEVSELGDIGFTIPGQAWTYWNRGRRAPG